MFLIQMLIRAFYGALTFLGSFFDTRSLVSEPRILPRNIDFVKGISQKLGIIGWIDKTVFF